MSGIRIQTARVIGELNKIVYRIYLPTEWNFWQKWIIFAGIQKLKVSLMSSLS
jgi:hypothetical protein